MSGAVMRAPEWFPRTPKEVAEVDQLLRQQVETSRQMAGQIGRLEGQFADLTARQDRHEATAQAMDAKLDQVLANQKAFGWVIRIFWMAAGALAAVGAWVWDHWPLFGGR